MALLIPPPLYWLTFAGAMWVLSDVLPWLTFANSTFRAMGLVLIVAGLSIDFLSLVQFVKRKTTVNPLRPTDASSLVTTGFFRFSRNPMYLGMLVSLLGWSVFLGSVAALFAIPLFVFILTTFQIIPEEKALREKFGSQYGQYCSSVRRWI